MSERMKRYEENDIIVQHLASHYVCGLLSPGVKRRVDALIRQQPRAKLSQAIRHWESNLSSLDDMTPELAPDSQSWQSLELRLELSPATPQLGLRDRLLQWWTAPTLLVNRAVAAMSMLALIVFGSIFYQPPQQALSYIAVLSQNDQPQLIAATYGDSLELRLDVIGLPAKTEEEDFELWVVSKTDKKVRSLGVINADEKSQRRTLSEAEWRLIKDSHSLLLTREEAGGSPLGEPSGEQVSYGLCIQMPEWSNKTS